VPISKPLKPQWFQILLALADRELHGLGIMKDVLEQTDGQMRLWPARLYGALKQMVEEGLIQETDGPARSGVDSDRRRFYRITAAGRAALAAEARRLKNYVEAADRKNVLAQSERS
jgi:DNA-binding PadR family transcriptional regulator